MSFSAFENSFFGNQCVKQKFIQELSGGLFIFMKNENKILSMNLFYFSIISLNLILEVTKAQLIFVINLFRHGARDPIHTENLHRHFDQKIPKIRSELNEIGLRQSYNLGKVIGQKYKQEHSLINKEGDYQTYTLQKNRNIDSAYSFLIGLREELSESKGKENKNISKVLDFDYERVMLNNPQFDWLFKPRCGNTPQLLDDIRKAFSDDVKRLEEEHIFILKFISYSLEIPLELVNLFNPQFAKMIEDVQSIQYKYGSVPSFIDNPEILDSLYFLHAYMHSVFVGEEQLGKVLISPMLIQINQLLNRFKTEEKLDFKLLNLCISQTNYYPFLLALNISNHECLKDRFHKKEPDFSKYVNCMEPPEFESSIQIEIYRNSKELEDLSVQILYNGKYVKIYDQNIEGQELDYEVDLKEFLTNLKSNYILENWKEICDLQNDYPSQNYSSPPRKEQQIHSVESNFLEKFKAQKFQKIQIRYYMRNITFSLFIILVIVLYKLQNYLKIKISQNE